MTLLQGSYSFKLFLMVAVEIWVSFRITNLQVLVTSIDTSNSLRTPVAFITLSALSSETINNSYVHVIISQIRHTLQGQKIKMRKHQET